MVVAMAPVPDLSAVHCWSDFSARLATFSARDRGTAFELLVRHYFRTAPVYRAKLAEVWLHSEVPADLRARLNFPPRDEGIDLLARTHTGEFWAVQAKYRADPDATLTHRELSTFTSLAFGVCREIAFALVCTTTARLPGLLSDLPHLGDLTGETWSALDADFFASLRASLASAAPPPLPVARTPLPHQVRAIAAAHAHYVERAAARGKLISPCGSGKSLTACWIAQNLAARRVLIAVPSIALIRQTLETWMREALARGQPADWVCVCSDADVAKTEQSELVAHVHELGLPTTQPDRLAAALAALRDHPGQIVVLTTYQSSPVLAAAAREAAFAFDLAVLDEAHRTTGRRAKNFSHLLFDENLPLPRRLFMTATERRFQGSSDEIVSMDDPALYGETFALLTFKAAIAATPPILCDYRILTIGVRASDVARLVAANRWLDLGADGLDEVTAQALASLIALRRATRDHGVRHTVSFHGSIARAQRFRDLCARLNAALPAEPPIAAHHVNGAMGSAARQRELDAFLTQTPSLVTNARCLTEGIDVPRIDCVFFADPKGSTIEIVQAAGRALRLADGKQLGYILLPLVVPDGATLDEIAESSAFKFVLFVLRALATHDDRIVDWFRATTEGRAPESSHLVHFDFGDVIAPLGVNASDFAKQIEVRCWESVGKLTPRPYAQTSEFARANGIRNMRHYFRVQKRMKAAGSWPADIPAHPEMVYRGRGWTSWGEFLATGNVDYKRGLRGYRRVWREFEAARAWVRTLRLRSSEQWYRFRNGDLPNIGTLPQDIPYCPDRSYKDKGWINWDDFLGVDWLPFDQARAYARSLKLTGQRQWKHYAKGERPDLPPKPDDLPAAPWYAYKDAGWSGWRDWLGTEKPIREQPLSTSPAKPRAPRKPRPSKHREFTSARTFAHSLQLRSSTQWYAYTHGKLPEKPAKPDDIPASPHNVYAEHWRGWGDWLGTGNVAPFRKKFRPFAEARAFARTLGLRTGDDWDRWCRTPGNRPPDIPANPEIKYRSDGWLSYADFLLPPPA
jgi:superfamily II DNA or RNA helicase